MIKQQETIKVIKQVNKQGKPVKLPEKLNPRLLIDRVKPRNNACFKDKSVAMK